MLKTFLEKLDALPLMEGLEVKAIKHSKGHGGERLNSGGLYLNGKKIALIEDGDWGAPFIVEPEKKFADLFDKVKKFVSDSKFSRTRDMGEGSSFTLDVDLSLYLSLVLNAAVLVKTVKSKKNKTMIFDKHQYAVIEYNIPYIEDPAYFDKKYGDEERYVILSKFLSVSDN